MRALILAPHGDDELNLIGTIAQRFVKNNYELHLVIVTNGDYNPFVTEQRHQETMAVAERLGISRVVFLGYGDTPAFDGIHTYHTKNGETFLSPAGQSATYGVEEDKDYSFQKNGFHHSYCRENVKADLKDCICEINADMIICVDFDDHADHRMTSLLFDEVMCELLQTTDYRPIVLKKFAYVGVWFGPEDYYNNPMRETILTPEEYYPYTPVHEIRADVPKKYYPVFYKHSKLYRLCQIYQSQFVTEHFTKMVNADALYFFRDTSNLSLQAKVTVSSGESQFINDFKLIDLRYINEAKKDILRRFDYYSWIPDSADTERKVVFRFSKPITVREIHFYFPYESHFRPLEMIITVDALSMVWNVENSIDGIFTLPQALSQVYHVEIRITKGSPGCGISEIEIFDHVSRFPWDQVPLKPFNSKKISRYRLGSSFVPVVEKKLHLLHMFIRYDLKKNGLKYYCTRIIKSFKK
ncbi:PIG-L family deacetylase [bacterium]|nr:PIG-L family deacetylase [bacterium]